jgi:hypothetical protein
VTTVSQIITDAYRISNLLAIGTSPTTDQQTEGLRYLNRIVLSVFGNEAGDPLEAFPIGTQGITAPAGYPWYGNVPSNDWFVPKNYRLMCNIDEPLTIPLHPDPDDGSRFAVIDVRGNFSSNPLTILGNGRLIEGAFQLELDEDSVDKQWFFREDLANWQLYSPLALDSEFPFGIEFDVFFIVLLAMHLNPAYGASIDGQTDMAYKRSAKQFRARYRQTIQMRSELGLTRLPRTAQDRYLWGREDWFYNPEAMFDKGWPY